MKKKPSSPREYVAFARIVEKYYGDWKYLISRSLVAGIFTGIGATLGLALVLYALSALFDTLGVVPVIGEFFTRANEFLQNYTQPVTGS